MALCLDFVHTDDRKKAYFDVCYVGLERLQHKHAALAVRHFGTSAHTADNIASAVSAILVEYGIPDDATAVTTDHGANVVAALRAVFV